MRLLYILLSFLLGWILCYITTKISETEKEEYIRLNFDYKVDSIGFLRKGTLLKHIKAYPEDFNRYALYINIHNMEFDNLEKVEAEYENTIIPYWLHAPDTTLPPQ